MFLSMLVPLCLLMWVQVTWLCVLYEKSACPRFVCFSGCISYFKKKFAYMSAKKSVPSKMNVYRNFPVNANESSQRT